MAKALGSKMSRPDSDFVQGGEWYTFKNVRVKALLRKAQTSKDPEKAVLNSLSVVLADHIANGTLDKSSLELASKIVGGKFHTTPVVEGVLTSVFQKLEFERRQGKESPNIRGRHKKLTEEQQRRMQTDVAMLAGSSKYEVIRFFGLQSLASKTFAIEPSVRPFCALDKPLVLKENVREVTRAM